MNTYCAHRRAHGFTLVELVTTIVIAGILSAVAVPRLFDNQAFSERGYIDEVAAAIRNAQKTAIATRCDVRVTLAAAAYSANQRDTLINCTNPATGWGTPVKRTDGGNLAGTAPLDVALNPATTIVFDSRGAVSNGAPPTVTVGPFSLTVNQTSGLVTVVP